MKIFRISVIVTSPNDPVLPIGSKVFIEDVNADYIREMSTGYALIDNRNGAIVYTVPAGLIVEMVLDNI
jgi:hypothetical protein